MADKRKWKSRRGGGERGRRPRRSPGTSLSSSWPVPARGSPGSFCNGPPNSVRYAFRVNRNAKFATCRLLSAIRRLPNGSVGTRSPPGASLDPCRLALRLAPASAVPPDRAEIVGAGRAGPGFGGTARDETFNRTPQPRALSRSARVEAEGRNRGRDPEGDAVDIATAGPAF